MLLERLLTRDRLSFDEAVEVLRTNHRVSESNAELYRLSLAFPERASRRLVGEDALHNAPGAATAEDEVERQDRARRASATAAALTVALRELGPRDRVILKMRFQDNFQVAQIARLLRVDAKPLYRQLEQIMTVLRRAMEAQGISREDVEAIAGRATVELEPVMGGDARGKSVARPSER